MLRGPTNAGPGPVKPLPKRRSTWRPQTSSSLPASSARESAFAELYRGDIFTIVRTDVIPGRGRGVAKAESPESIITDREYGFRARCSAAPRNDRDTGAFIP